MISSSSTTSTEPFRAFRFSVLIKGASLATSQRKIHDPLANAGTRHLLPRRSLTPKASSPITTAFSYAEGLVTYYHGVLLRRRPRHLLPRRSLTPKASSPITTPFSYAEGVVTYYHAVPLRRRRSLIQAQGCRNPGG